MATAINAAIRASPMTPSPSTQTTDPLDPPVSLDTGDGSVLAVCDGVEDLPLSTAKEYEARTT
jgi:hypothetical protein